MYMRNKDEEKIQSKSRRLREQLLPSSHLPTSELQQGLSTWRWLSKILAMVSGTSTACDGKPIAAANIIWPDRRLYGLDDPGLVQLRAWSLILCIAIARWAAWFLSRIRATPSTLLHYYGVLFFLGFFFTLSDSLWNISDVLKSSTLALGSLSLRTPWLVRTLITRSGYNK